MLEAELFWFRGSAVLLGLKGSPFEFPDPTFPVSGSVCLATVSPSACKTGASSSNTGSMEDKTKTSKKKNYEMKGVFFKKKKVSSNT